MFKPKNKKRKRRLRKLVSVMLIVTLFFMWTIVFTPKVNEVRAGEVTDSSSGSWISPITGNATVELWGGGGGGGGGGNNNQGGGGGAGGQYSIKVVSVTASTEYPYSVGGGGTCGTKVDGGPGGDTTFNTDVVIAKGGEQGYVWVSGGGAGGTGSTTGGVGDTVRRGGHGANGSDSNSGGGGGGAGSGGDGGDASGISGGTGTADYGGSGGNGTSAANGAGGAGSVYGGAAGGSTKNGVCGGGAGGFVRITWTDAAVLTQDDFRWYEDENSLTLTNLWGTVITGDNEDITAVPVAMNPPTTGDKLRLQINVAVTVAGISAGAQDFILQYKTGTDQDCSTGSWTDVGAISATGVHWRYFDNTNLTHGDTQVNQISTSTGGAEGDYVEVDPTQTNPNAVGAGENMEWDFAIEPGPDMVDAASYAFRLIQGGTGFTVNYTAGDCPTLETAPGTANLLRHGNFFVSEVEKGFYWAD